MVVMEGFLSLSVMRSLRRKGEWRSLSDNTACKHPNSNLKLIKPCLVIKILVFFKNIFLLDEFSRQLLYMIQYIKYLRNMLFKSAFFISYVWTLHYKEILNKNHQKVCFNSVVSQKLIDMIITLYYRTVEIRKKPDKKLLTFSFNWLLHLLDCF